MLNPELKLNTVHESKPKEGTYEITSEESLDIKQERIGLEQRINKDLENGGLKDISLTLVSAPHSSEKDIPDIAKYIKDADIIAPEICNWDSGTLEDMRKVSQGMAPQPILDRYSNFYRKILTELSNSTELYNPNSQKHIIFLDLPKGEELIDRTDSAEEKLALDLDMISADFDLAIEKFEHNIQEYTELVREREAYMLKTLESEIKEFQSTHSNQKPNVLMILGSAHTEIYHKIREKMGERARRVFMPDMPIYTNFQEVMRRYWFKKPINKDLLARTVLELHLSLIFNKIFIHTELSSNQQDQFQRNIVKNFDYNEIKRFFENTNFDSTVTDEEQASAYIELLFKKGIILEKELEKYQAKQPKLIRAQS